MQVLSYKIQKLKGRGKLIRRNRKSKQSKIAIAMEFGLRRSGEGGGGAVKEEKRSTESSGTDGDDHEPPHHHHQQDTTLVEVQPNNSSVRSMVETVLTASSKEEVDDELESARAEMGEVREENERLKTLLERIMKEYEALQMQFQVIANQDQTDLVSLSLGRLPSKSQDKTKVTSKELDDDLALGLDCKFETSKSGSSTELAFPNNNSSPTNSSQLPKEEAAESTLPPSKASRADHSNVDQDEVSQQNPAKKARVCVRARCDTPTMNDGCQWRKYGQKISKGNPCPRAYYRCTVAPNCPVRKQVQRCADDMSILITTYEGTHSHPLPLSATAMASTTSAAASMLMSGSSSTSHHPPPSTSATTTASDHLHGLNLYLSSSDGIIGSKPKQFYLSNPALSPSPSHPTITLDLTTTSNNNIPSSSSNRFINLPPRLPSSSTSLSFTTSSEPNTAFTWGNNNNAFLTYNNYNTQLTHQPFNNNIRSMNILHNNINLGRQLPMPIPTQNSSLPDTIAAATKVITADPSFQSALAAALSSIIGSGSSNNTSGIGITTQGVGVGESLGHINKNITKLGESSTNSKVNNNGCAASSFLNRTTSSASTQTGSTSLVFLQPSSLPFSNSNSASPGDHNRDNNSNS